MNPTAFGTLLAGWMISPWAKGSSRAPASMVAAASALRPSAVAIICTCSAMNAPFSLRRDFTESRCSPDRCAAYQARWARTLVVEPSSPGEAIGTVTR